MESDLWEPTFDPKYHLKYDSIIGTNITNKSKPFGYKTWVNESGIQSTNSLLDAIRDY